MQLFRYRGKIYTIHVFFKPEVGRKYLTLSGDTICYLIGFLFYAALSISRNQEVFI